MRGFSGGLLEMAGDEFPGAGSQRGVDGPGGTEYHVGVYGWRKRCLYLLVLLLTVILIVNLALTMWILRVMHFNLDGMGHLRMSEEGLRLEGESEFLLPLYAKEIHSRKESPLLMHSARNVTVNARNSDGHVTGRLTVGADALHYEGSRLEITSPQGRSLFVASDDEVVVGADRLRVTGAEGAIFEHSVQTPQIRAEAFNELKLEAPTRSLTMDAPKGVSIRAEAGGLEAMCRTDITLQSTEGAVVLDAARVLLPKLPEGTKGSGGPVGGAGGPVYELCSCPNGKLYLAEAGPRSTCLEQSGICQ